MPLVPVSHLCLPLIWQTLLWQTAVNKLCLIDYLQCMKHHAAFCARAFSQSLGACWPLHHCSQSVGMLTFLNQEWAVLDKCFTLLTFWETIWRPSLCFPKAPTELSPYYQQQRLRIKSYIVFYYFSFLTVSFYSVLFTRFTVPFSAK